MLWLNVGSGDFPAADPWINIDTNTERCKPKIAASVGSLPFATGSVDRLYAGHVLEHVPVFAVPEVIAEFVRVLAADGSLMLIGPDVRLALDDLQAGKLSWEEYGQMLLGGHRWNGDEHKWACTENVIAEAAELVGLEVASIRPIAALQASDWPVVAYTEWQYALEGKLR